MAPSHDLCYTIVDIRRLLEYRDSYASVLQYFTFVTSIVICLVGLVGNAVVICFLGFIMKKYKSKYWFLNLAITDFLALLTLPFRAISDLKGTWTFGPHMCKLYLFSLCVSMYAGVYILIVLNIARVLSVAKPMFHLKFISQRVSLWICSLFWCIPILLSLPVFYIGNEVKIGEATLCTFMDSKTVGIMVNKQYNVSSENITFSDVYTKLSPYIEHCSPDTCCGGERALEFWNYLIAAAKALVIPLLIVGYFLPLGTVIICNITIVAHVRKSNTTNTHKLYRLVLIIILVYFITRTPLVIAEIMILNTILNMNLISMLNVLTFMPLLTNIACLNSCFNPIMYMLNGGQMRTRLSDFISNIRNRYK